VTVSRASPATMAALITRVRDELGDPSVDHEGNTIPEGARRWSDSRCLRTINDALIALQVKIQGGHPGEFLVRSSPLFYPDAGADLNLSSTIGGSSVYAVFLANESGDIVRELNYVGLSEVERFGGRYSAEKANRYTITSNTTGAVILKIRPRPSGFRVVIDMVAEPVTAGAQTDTSPISVRWQELLVLEAAYALMAPDDEFGLQAMDRLTALRQDFQKHAGRRKGIARIQRRRRMRPLR